MHQQDSSSFKDPPRALSEIRAGFGGQQALLVPLILWFALLAWVARVTVFSRRRPGTEFADIDVLAAVQISLVFVVLMAVLLSARVLPMWSKTAGTSVRMLFIYYSLCALSALWSPMPDFTLYRAFEFMTLLMGVLVALSYSPNFLKAERTVLIISSIVIIMSMYVTVRYSGFSLSWQKWHTNSYSASAAIIFCYCLGEYFQSDKNRKKRLKWFGGFALGALILGTSAASNVAAMFGVLLVTFLRRSTALVIISGCILVILLTLTFIVTIDYSVPTSILFPGKSPEQIYSVHGRLGMWEILLGVFKQSPIFGHGFAVLSTGRGHVFANDPHNSLFSVILGTGFLGALTVLIYSFRLMREFFRTAFHRVPGAIGCTAAICAGLVNSLAMPLVFDEWEESSLVFACMTAFLIMFVLLPYRQQNRNREIDRVETATGKRLV